MRCHLPTTDRSAHSRCFGPFPSSLWRWSSGKPSAKLRAPTKTSGPRKYGTHMSLSGACLAGCLHVGCRDVHPLSLTPKRGPRWPGPHSPVTIGGAHVRVPLGAFLSVVPAVDSPPTSVAVDCSSVPPHSLLRFLAARFLLPDPPLASRFMAMWRAAARQLVDRALGSRAAHVIQSSLPYLSRRLRFDPMVTLFLL